MQVAQTSTLITKIRTLTIFRVGLVWCGVGFVLFRKSVVMQAKGNKKQILAMKYQVWTSAFLQNFRIFWCFFVVKKLFGRPLFSFFLTRPFRL